MKTHDLLSSASPKAVMPFAFKSEADVSGESVEVEYVDEHTTARLLGLPVKLLRNWRVQGNGPPFAKFGRCVRYNVRSTRRWAAAQERRSTSEVA